MQRQQPQWPPCVCVANIYSYSLFDSLVRLRFVYILFVDGRMCGVYISMNIHIEPTISIRKRNFSFRQSRRWMSLASKSIPSSHTNQNQLPLIRVALTSTTPSGQWWWSKPNEEWKGKRNEMRVPIHLPFWIWLHQTVQTTAKQHIQKRKRQTEKRECEKKFLNDAPHEFGC